MPNESSAERMESPLGESTYFRESLAEWGTCNTQIHHIYREANSLTDYMANIHTTDGLQ